jgi:hypothetical protein
MFSIGAAAGPVIMGKMFDSNGDYRRALDNDSLSGVRRGGDDHVAAISRKAVTAEHNSLVTRCRAAATCFGR